MFNDHLKLHRLFIRCLFIYFTVNGLRTICFSLKLKDQVFPFHYASPLTFLFKDCLIFRKSLICMRPPKYIMPQEYKIVLIWFLLSLAGNIFNLNFLCCFLQYMKVFGVEPYFSFGLTTSLLPLLAHKVLHLS